MPPVRRRTLVLTLAIFAAVFAGMRVASYTRKSATWDEPIHLTSGYAALARGDYRIDPAHPPFARMWAALPLLAMDVTLDTRAIDATPNQQWLLGPDAYAFARPVSLSRQRRRFAFLYAARFMIVLLGIRRPASCVSSGSTSGWVTGRRSARLLFYGVSAKPQRAPLRSVTTDVGRDAGSVPRLSTFLWAVLAAGGRPARSPALAGSWSLALITKFSAADVGAIVVVLLASHGAGPQSVATALR